MSVSGDEKKSIDVEASLAAIAQQKMEKQRQESFQTEQAALLGTETGQKTRDLSDSILKLTKVLKDANIVQTSDARSLALRQDTANKALENTIKTVEGKTYLQGSGRSYYTLADGTPITNAMVDQWKRDLADGKSNLVEIEQAVAQGETNKEAYNKSIRELEQQALRPELKEPITYKSSPKKAPENVTRQFPEQPDIKLTTRTKKQTQFIKDLVNADIKDKQQAQNILEKVSPTYANTVTNNPELGAKLIADYNAKLRRYEQLSDYQTPIGIEELTGSESAQNINKVKARLAHATMSANKAFIETLPFAILGTIGGPVSAGLVGSMAVATMLNPKNRKQLEQYVEAHPQEFLASLGGSLLAGVTVAESTKAFNKYTKDLKISQRRKLEAQWDKIIDDYAYLEQPKGAEFPSRAIEVPEPYGNQIIISDPIDAESAILERFLRGVVEKNPGEAIQDYFKAMKDAGAAMYVDLGGGKLESLTIPEMLDKYSGLKEPWYNPAFRDPNILNKASIVARSNNPNINYSPLLAAVLLQVSKQGYITEAQIKELIKTNQANLQTLKEMGVTIPSDFSDAKIADLSIPQLVELANQVEKQEVVQLTPLMVETITQTIPEPIIPEPIEPIEPIITGKFTSKQVAETRRQIRGFEPSTKYRVNVDGLIIVVEARGYPDAVNKALRQRGAKRKLPQVIEVERAQ